MAVQSRRRPARALGRVLRNRVNGPSPSLYQQQISVAHAAFRVPGKIKSAVSQLSAFIQVSGRL